MSLNGSAGSSRAYDSAEIGCLQSHPLKIYSLISDLPRYTCSPNCVLCPFDFIFGSQQRLPRPVDEIRHNRRPHMQDQTLGDNKQTAMNASTKHRIHMSTPSRPEETARCLLLSGCLSEIRVLCSLSGNRDIDMRMPASRLFLSSVPVSSIIIRLDQAKNCNTADET